MKQLQHPKLLDLEFFQGIDEETMEAIDQLPIRIKNFESGEIVNFFGDCLEYIYIIIEGCLKTNEYLMSGKEVVSSYYFAKDAFPFYLVYGGRQTYPYNVCCHKKAKVYALPIQGFKEIIAKDAKLMENILVFVSKYCVKNKMVIQAASYPKVAQRLAFWLLASADCQGDYHIPGTQQLFADRLLVNRSSLNQEIKNFEGLGYIQKKGRSVHLNDRSALEALIQEQ